MDGATATEGKALRVFQRTGKLRIATRLNFKFCSDEQDPEVAGTRARNAQWIGPNRRLGAARAGVAANQLGRRYMNRHSMRTLGRVAVPVVLSFGLAGGRPAPAQQNPPPPNLSRSL